MTNIFIYYKIYKEYDNENNPTCDDCNLKFNNHHFNKNGVQKYDHKNLESVLEFAKTEGKTLREVSGDWYMERESKAMQKENLEII